MNQQNQQKIDVSLVGVNFSQRNESPPGVSSTPRVKTLCHRCQLSGVTIPLHFTRLLLSVPCSAGSLAGHNTPVRVNLERVTGVLRPFPNFRVFFSGRDAWHWLPVLMTDLSPRVLLVHRTRRNAHQLVVGFSAHVECIVKACNPEPIIRNVCSWPRLRRPCFDVMSVPNCRPHALRSHDFRSFSYCVLNDAVQIHCGLVTLDWMKPEFAQILPGLEALRGRRKGVGGIVGGGDTLPYNIAPFRNRVIQLLNAEHSSVMQKLTCMSVCAQTQPTQ